LITSNQRKLYICYHVNVFGCSNLIHLFHIFGFLLKLAHWALIVLLHNSIKLVEYVNRKSFPFSSTRSTFLFLAHFNIYQQNQYADTVISYLLESQAILVVGQIFGQILRVAVRYSAHQGLFVPLQS